MIEKLRSLLYLLDTTEHLSPFGLSSGSIIVSTLFSDFQCQVLSKKPIKKFLMWPLFDNVSVLYIYY